MDSFIQDESQRQERQVGCQTDRSDGTIAGSHSNSDHLEVMVMSQQLQLDAFIKRITAIEDELSEIRVRLV